MIKLHDRGSIKGKDAMMKEIFNRGPIACNVDANYILNYTTGIVTAKFLGVELAVVKHDKLPCQVVLFLGDG